MVPGGRLKSFGPIDAPCQRQFSRPRQAGLRIGKASRDHRITFGDGRWQRG